jgi:adenylylsulfate kinase
VSWAIWITGLPGSGKTTVARAVADALAKRGLTVSVLELTQLRQALLGGRQETEHERDIVHRALVFTAKALTEAGVPVIVDGTASRRDVREWARTLIPRFGEVQLVCSPELCVVREQEGRWRRPSTETATMATLPEPIVEYEMSLKPDVTVDTESREVWFSVEEVLRLVERLERAAQHTVR